MTFQSEEQRGRACAAICERIPDGPWWELRDDCEQPPSILRPSEKALEALNAWREMPDSAKRAVAPPGLEVGTMTLLRCAFDFWGGFGDATISDVEHFLDPGNKAMIGGLIVALAQADATRAIEVWIAKTRTETLARIGRLPKRQLAAVIDDVAAIVPELAGDLRAVRESSFFTPPEWMVDRWQEATAIVAARVPPEHPKYKEVLEIWNGNGYDLH